MGMVLHQWAGMAPGDTSLEQWEHRDKMLVTDLSSHELNPKHYFYSVGLVLALLFALLDHNPEQLGFPLLLASWLLQGLLPVSLLILCQQRLEHVPALQQRAAWLKLLLCGLCASLLFAGPALLLDVALGLDPQYQGWQHWATAWWHEVLAVAPLITVAWIAANAPWLFGFRLIRPQSNLQCSPDTPDVSPHPGGGQVVQASSPLPLTADFNGLQRQLPPDRRGELLYLKSELHYLLVVTAQGRSLILCNLKDAIAELPESSGFSPHRSYWVSTAAVQKFSRQGRQGQLLLQDGSKIPVSRTQMPIVTTLLQAYSL